MKTPKSILKFVMAAATLVVLGSTGASAQNWTAGGDGTSWGDPDNWDSSPFIPDGAGITVNLTASLSGQQNTNLLGATYTVGTLNVGSTSGAGYFYLNGGTLNFNNNGSGAVLNHISTSAGEQLNNLVINLQDNLTVNENQTGTTGTPYGLEFGYGVGTSVTGTGDLTINNNNPNGSQLNYGYGGSVAVYGTVNNVGAVNVGGTGTGQTEFHGDIGSNVTQVVQNSTTSKTLFLGNLDGTGNLKVEAGTMVFGSGSGYDKPAKVIVGDTAASGPNATLDTRGIGTWTTGSAQTVSGFGTILGNQLTTVAGTTLAPGSVGHIGTLNVSSPLTLASGTNLSFILGGSGQSSQLDTQSLTLASGLNLLLADNAGADGLGSLGLGTYELMGYSSLSGASLGDISNLFNITAPAGFSYSVTDTGLGQGQVDLIVAAAAPEPGTWALFLGGFGVLAVMRWTNRRKVA